MPESLDHFRVGKTAPSFVLSIRSGVSFSRYTLNIEKSSEDKTTAESFPVFYVFLVRNFHNVVQFSVHFCQL